MLISTCITFPFSLKEKWGVRISWTQKTKKKPQTINWIPCIHAALLRVTAKKPCLWLWPGAACRSATGRAQCTAGRTRSGAACVGWCWVTWRYQRWTSVGGARCSGCRMENKISKLVLYGTFNSRLSKIPADYDKVLKNFGNERLQILENNNNRRLLWISDDIRAAFLPRSATAGFLN